MEKIKINDKEYILERNINDCFKLDEISDLLTDYFDDFDYILGDYAYDKLRLKGFCNEDNKRFSEINDITTLDDYIENYCSYKGSYFLLKKIS